MRHVILDYVQKLRALIGEDKRCVIIFDGHKGHLSELLCALCAQQNIQIVVLPLTALICHSLLISTYSKE